jgi:hypothetical protein
MLVDVIRDAVSGFAGFRSKKARMQTILELLCIYFLLLDVATEGRALWEAVGSNPKMTIAHAPDADRAALLSAWHEVLRRQVSRLSMLSERLFGQDALAVFNPRLKVRLESIVRSKFKRVNSLHGIGAGLVLSLIAGDPKDQELSRDLILSMYPRRSRVTIDLKAAHRELDELSGALEVFRTVCMKLSTNDEVLAISKKARRLTKCRLRHY